MGTGGDHFLPGGHIVVNIQRLNILAMGRKLAGVLVVKLKNIDDHLLLGLVKNTLLTAHIYQHTDLFFRHLFIVPMSNHTSGAKNLEDTEISPDTPREICWVFFIATRLGTSSPNTRVT